MLESNVKPSRHIFRTCHSFTCDQVNDLVSDRDKRKCESTDTAAYNHSTFCTSTDMNMTSGVFNRFHVLTFMVKRTRISQACGRVAEGEGVPCLQPHPVEAQAECLELELLLKGPCKQNPEHRGTRTGPGSSPRG